MSDDCYQFSPSQHQCNTPFRQWVTLVATALQTVTPLLRGDVQRTTQQVWRVKRECETLHRIMCGRGADVGMARESIEKVV